MSKKKPRAFKVHVPAERLGDPHLFVEGVCPASLSRERGVVKEVRAITEREALLIARGWKKGVARIIEPDEHDQDLARRETKEFP